MCFGGMAAVNVTNVAILNNPTNFNQPLQFEIQYECVSNLADGKYTALEKPAGLKWTLLALEGPLVCLMYAA